MLPLKLQNREGGLRILCLGAHCDDIEIGCGGTIMRLSEEYKIQEIKWLVFTSTPERSLEARRSAEHFLENFSSKEIIIKEFRDCFLPYVEVDVKNYFEKLKDFQPDIIFTHCRHDLHQDHRLLCELTWNTFRNHLIFEYEIPKYEGDLGNPNFFVPLEGATAKRKVQSIMNFFPSQSNRHWFDQDTFFSLMRIRGLESASKTRYAEAFYLRKLTI